MELCIALLMCLLCLSNAQTSSLQQLDATEATNRITKQLYQSIRNIALPSVPVTNNRDVTLLLSPGKVLNYFDYYPGQEYTNFIQVGLSMLF